MNVYIETGAETGDTLGKANYPIKYAVEYDYKLYLYCKNRYIKDNSITLIHGDSRDVLNNLLFVVNKPVFIFLDASNQTQSVLVDELELIMSHQGDYTIMFNKSNIGKMGKYGLITLDFIQTLVKSAYYLDTTNPTHIMMFQKSGSDISASECSSSDSL